MRLAEVRLAAVPSGSIAPPIPTGLLDQSVTYWAPQLQVRPSAPAPTKSWTFDPPPLHWMILAVAGGMGAVLLVMRLAKK